MKTEPKQARAKKPNWVTTLDEVHDRLNTIETVTALMEACGEREVEPEIVRGAGELIRQAMWRIRELLSDWRGVRR